jgi:tRNA(Arg) A34 adenosine deaminase TadA/ADP-ribose pyrophosphatase YjhB (NUDIX family)
MALPHRISTLLYAFDEQGRVLLLERAKEPNRGQWSPFGGKLKIATGESPWTCACREAAEETGLQLTPADLHLTGIVSEHGYQGQAHWLMFLFEVKPRLRSLPPPHREGKFGFFAPAAIATLPVPPTDREMIWPLFWRHRGGFFAAHCRAHPDGHNIWTLEASNAEFQPGPASYEAEPRSAAGTRQIVMPGPLIDHDSDEHFMDDALRQARRAAAAEEVPVGAAIVRMGRIIARAFNQVELLHDATAHAEMLALTQAQAAVGDWRLTDCTLFVTNEPCPMCAGAIVHARIARVVFGASDPKAGAAGGAMNLLQFPTLNHRCDLTGGVRAAEARVLLRDFFAGQRAKRTKPRTDAGG